MGRTAIESSRINLKKRSLSRARRAKAENSVFLICIGINGIIIISELCGIFSVKIREFVLFINCVLATLREKRGDFFL
jgi:hypothetical protein